MSIWEETRIFTNHIYQMDSGRFMNERDTEKTGNVYIVKLNARGFRQR